MAVQMLLGAGLLGLGLGGYGAVRLLRDRDLRFLGVTAVVLVVFFVATGGRPHYVAGLYGLLAAAGAVGLQRRRGAGHTRLRWVAWPASVLAAALAGFVLHSSVAAANPAAPERLATGTATAYDALPAPLRDRTAIVGGSYIYAAYVDAYSARLGTPRAFSLSRSYGYFPPPPEDLDAALYIGPDPAALRGSFTEVRPPPPIEGGGATDLTGEDVPTPVWLLSGRHEPWSAIWARERSLVVS